MDGRFEEIRKIYKEWGSLSGDEIHFLLSHIDSLQARLDRLTEAASDLLDDTPYYPDDDENTGRMVYVKHLRKLKAVKGE